MDDFREFVRRFEEALGAALPALPGPPRPVSASASDAPVALLFSPHPDDEVIIGALALRLQREAGARVVNLAVTLGSDPARRAGRRHELEQACAFLGWELEVPSWPADALATVGNDTAAWAQWVSVAAEALTRWRPCWVFYPHAEDGHPAHRATNRLARAALGCAALPTPPWRVQTEYWQPLAEPNLLVECPPDDLAQLVAALCCHAGEIARNSYHRTLPAWMADNVRRGAERVAEPGSPAPKFPFGVLYRVESGLPPGWDSILSSDQKLKI
jgi:N-acetylglucosamine malate deacetylase 1